MDLIIIRHGETDENSRGVIHGHSGGTLSALGRKQAIDLAAKLKNEHISAMYSSDFQRCIETAELLHTYHQNILLQFTSELREMHGGTLNKMGFPPRLVVSGIQLLKLLHIKTPGGESWEELCARVGSFLNEVYKKHPHDTIVLITHGIAMQAMCSLLEDNRGRKFKLEEVPNCTAWKMKMKKSIMNLKKQD
jgi:broad specificity phosphatase PhoE